jgi:hypothetical protein
MYKLMRSPLTNEIDIVLKQETGVLRSIPFNPANTDYQEYLKWLAEGNEPLPADE